MQTIYLRYHYLEKKKFWYRFLWLMPAGVLSYFWLNPRIFHRWSQMQGDYQGIEIELPFEEKLAEKMKRERVWKALRKDIQEQREIYKNCVILLDEALFSIYLKQEEQFYCYPSRELFIQELTQEKNPVGKLLCKHSALVWTKLFFLKELVEYERILHGIRKKVFRLIIIEGNKEETKRAIKLLYPNQNYMSIVTKQPEAYETILKEILEETGLSILVIEKQLEMEKEEREKTLIIDMNHLFSKVSQIEITQCGIRIEPPILFAVLMESVLDENAEIKEEKLEERKREDNLYLKKVISNS